MTIFESRDTTEHRALFARRHRDIPTYPAPLSEKDSISPGWFPRGRPGPLEALFWGFLFLDGVSTSPLQPFSNGFFRIRRRNNTCGSHTFSSSRLKTTSGAERVKQKKNRTSKTNIPSYLSRAVLLYRRPFSSTGRTGFLASRSLTSRLDATSKNARKSAPRN